MEEKEVEVGDGRSARRRHAVFGLDSPGRDSEKGIKDHYGQTNRLDRTFDTTGPAPECRP